MGCQDGGCGGAAAMKVLTWQEFNRDPPQEGLAATVGVFDGLHMGHQALIATVKQEKPHLFPCVITFRENPKKFLHPSSYRGSLLTIEQKLSAIQSEGIEYCVLIDFSDNFATLAGREFLAALYNANVRFVAVGENFQFGYKLDTDAAKLEALSGEIGMRSCSVKNVMYRGHPVSSSRVRHAVLENRLREAEEMLGRPYQIVARRERRGEHDMRELFVPEDDLLVPPDGEYDVFVRDDETIEQTKVNVFHRHIALGLRMQSERIRLAFVDKATQKENLVWL
jgi:riboflavin kinase/FMN adenylyltransferase